jgi:hypothetical protein
MKRYLLVIGAGVAVGLLLAALFLFIEFGGTEEILSPYRPERLNPSQ